MLENTRAWASQEGGKPLRNTDLENIVGLELIFRAKTHGPQPIIIPRALPESTFSISNIRSPFSKLLLEQWTHTVLYQRQKSQSPISHLHLQIKSALSTDRVFHFISSTFVLMSTCFSTTHLFLYNFWKESRFNQPISKKNYLISLKLHICESHMRHSLIRFYCGS